VVAPNDSPIQAAWRTEGLHKAAVYSGLNHDTLYQPAWTEANISAIMSKSGEVSRGYALSFLGHLNAVQKAAQYSTTLILEDDVDWDIGLRAQMPLIAEAIRNLTTSKPAPTIPIPTPYGKDWDILWLGHCGDSIPLGDKNAIQHSTLGSRASPPIPITPGGFIGQRVQSARTHTR
jgi:hypothetical protein